MHPLVCDTFFCERAIFCCTWRTIIGNITCKSSYCMSLKSYMKMINQLYLGFVSSSVWVPPTVSCTFIDHIYNKQIFHGIFEIPLKSSKKKRNNCSRYSWEVSMPRDIGKQVRRNQNDFAAMIVEVPEMDIIR